jgi:MerR family transcriptional regulator/heat shock protein HspR
MMEIVPFCSQKFYDEATQDTRRSSGAAGALGVRNSDALFVISVAARLVDLHPTTLRKYERVGFLEPTRTPGRTRLYSGHDIARLRQIKYLVEEREVNLAGVQVALDLARHLRAIADALETSDDPGVIRRRASGPLQQAMKAIGAAD